VEAGLRLVEKEYQTKIGRIDVLARDENEIPVVIELKAGVARKEVLGQILSYIASLKKELNENRARGIIIAKDFEDGLKLAASELQNIKLVKYIINFDFEVISKEQSP
jgi:RecB family endonuclease NucS